ncbi:MAG: SUMF1/EgtB/PvdO family nonheme iron enzyme [Anaerolineae bacterium]|nr:SUMF1/EgtB/PvdO family nonheme iron enzyme [Anaerolineae bacterium]
MTAAPPSTSPDEHGKQPALLAVLRRWQRTLADLRREADVTSTTPQDDNTVYMAKLSQTISRLEEMMQQELEELQAQMSSSGNLTVVSGDAAPFAMVGDNNQTVINGGAAAHDQYNSEIIIQNTGTLIFKPPVTSGADSHPGRGTRGGKSRPGGWTASLTPEIETYLKRTLITANRIPLGELHIRASDTIDSMQALKLQTLYVPLDTVRLQRSNNLDQSTDATRTGVPLMEAAILNRRLVILGDPGSGKSTFLNYLMICLAWARLMPEGEHLERLNVPSGTGRRSSRWTHGPLLPILINLRELAEAIPPNTQRGTANLVWEFIAEEFKQDDQPHLAAEVREELNTGQCIVLFDGLDEITNQNQRQVIREAITAFADTHDSNRYIVTCRTLSYINPAWRLGSFPMVAISPLSDYSIEVFIRNWYTTLARAGQEKNQRWASRHSEELIEASGNLGDLPRNPLLLTVMAVIHTYRGELPRKRAQLYNDCIELLLWEWQRTKRTANGSWKEGILDALNIHEQRLMAGLSQVAFDAYEAISGGSMSAGIPQSVVLKVLKTYLDDDWGKAQIFCNYVEERSGLLVSRGKGPDDEPVYAFPHRGFQEFLAGRHIVNGWEFARTITALAARGDAWREVILLAVGHLVYNSGEITRPLDAVNLLCMAQPADTTTRWRMMWLAGEILNIIGRSDAEKDEHLGRKIVPRVVQELAQLVNNGYLSPSERAAASDVLGRLGDPRPGVCSRLPEMQRIPGGAFELGGQHITVKPFHMSRYPITNAQFRAFLEDGYRDPRFWTPEGLDWRKRSENRGSMAYDPNWGVANRPVSGVTWYEAIAYTNWLSDKTGQRFRLPTEAEWEFAAAGTEGRRYPLGNRAKDDSANIRETTIGHTTGVGIFPEDRTPDGLYDMTGNVWEWCSSLALDYPYKTDNRHENLNTKGARIMRGGCYDSPKRTIHSIQRHVIAPETQMPFNGFRVAKDG